MATPKKRVPLSARKSRADIQKAMQNAERMETPNVTKEEGSARRDSPPAPSASSSPPPPAAAPRKRLGRTPVKEGRTARLSIYLTPDVKKRLTKAVLQEKLRRLENDEAIDQSLIIEEALELWLKTHQY